MSFSENLKKLRKENKMSQEEFAEMLGVTRQAVYKWESDKGYPKVETLIIISENLHASIDRLLDLEFITNGDETNTSSLSYEKMDEIAQEVVEKHINKLLVDDCMVAIHDNMEINWYINEDAQRKMRLALTNVLVNTAHLDIIIAKNTSEMIVSTIQEQILQTINSNLPN